VAGEGVVREAIPLGGNQVSAVYLVPFHRAERSLAAGLTDLLHAEQDRMAAFA
jgi:exodeoxyribonuclease V alpha subunit